MHKFTIVAHEISRIEYVDFGNGLGLELVDGEAAVPIDCFRGFDSEKRLDSVQVIGIVCKVCS